MRYVYIVSLLHLFFFLGGYLPLKCPWATAITLLNVRCGTLGTSSHTLPSTALVSFYAALFEFSTHAGLNNEFRQSEDLSLPGDRKKTLKLPELKLYTLVQATKEDLVKGSLLTWIKTVWVLWGYMNTFNLAVSVFCFISLLISCLLLHIIKVLNTLDSINCS